MGVSPPTTEAKPSNPFTPDWGVGPPVLVGRDEHIDRAERAMRSGPRDLWFTHAYYGERGVGKTVLLDAIGERVAGLGWPVVHNVVRGRRFVEVLLRLGLPEARRRLTRRGLGRGQLTIEAEIDLGVVRAEAQRKAEATPRLPIEAELEVTLRRLGELAADKKRGVLLTVDEAHAAETTDLLVLSQTLQLVTKRRQLPIALIVAGLPQLPSLLTGPEMTFLERMPKIELGFLGPDASRLALTKPAADRGVRFTDDALTILVDASGGYPYFVQLLGYQVWEAKRGRIVDRAAVTTALREAARMAAIQVFTPRWERLAPKEQQFLRVMTELQSIDHDRPVAVGSVREKLGAASYEDISYLRIRLLQKGVVRPAGRGLLRFTFPGMAEWIRSAETGH